nr:hypothetical protein [Thiomonas sp.]
MNEPTLYSRFFRGSSVATLIMLCLAGCASVSSVAQVDPGVYEVAASGKAWRDATSNLQVDALKKADAFCQEKGLVVHVLGQSSATGVSGSAAAVQGFDNAHASAAAAGAYSGPFESGAGAAAAESSRSAGLFGGFVHHGIPSTAMVRFSCVTSTTQR